MSKAKSTRTTLKTLLDHVGINPESEDAATLGVAIGKFLIPAIRKYAHEVMRSSRKQQTSDKEILAATDILTFLLGRGPTEQELNDFIVG